MFSKQREYMPLLYVKLFAYQLIRAVAYLHSGKIAVCHRDIKPQNLLIDPTTGMLKLCDFGSAKQLTPGEASVAYICSRYYRAPGIDTNGEKTHSLIILTHSIHIHSPFPPTQSSSSARRSTRVR